MAVARFSDVATFQFVVASHSTNNNIGIRFGVDTSGFADVAIGNGTSSLGLDTNPEALSVDTLAVIRYSCVDGASVEMIVQKDSGTEHPGTYGLTPSTSDSDGALRIGSRTNNSLPILPGGKLGDIVIHDGRFTPAEVSAWIRFWKLKYGDALSGVTL
jgi:hypothetical protein